MEVKYLNLEYFFNRILEFLQNFSINITVPDIEEFLAKLKIISIYFIIFFIIGIIFLFIKLTRLRKKKIETYIDIFLDDGLPEERSEKWNIIKERMKSEDFKQWKTAIIEADLIMDAILNRIGYEGDSLTEKLQNIEPSDFDNLQNVWEANKVRNRIDHEGDKFEIIREEAENVIEKYEKALKEFKYI